jgi:hypothetical protein
VYSLPRWERSNLAGEALEFGTARALADTGGSCTVRVPAGAQAAPTGCGELMAGGIRLSRTSRRLPCGHDHWLQEAEAEQRTEADMWVLAGSSGRFAVVLEELEDTHAIDIAQEGAA